MNIVRLSNHREQSAAHIPEERRNVGMSARVLVLISVNDVLQVVRANTDRPGWVVGIKRIIGEVDEDEERLDCAEGSDPNSSLFGQFGLLVLIETARCTILSVQLRCRNEQCNRCDEKKHKGSHGNLL